MSEFLIARHDDKSFSVLNMDKVGALTVGEESIYYILDFQKDRSATLIDVVNYTFCSGQQISETMKRMGAKHDQTKQSH